MTSTKYYWSSMSCLFKIVFSRGNRVIANPLTGMTIAEIDYFYDT